VRNLIPPVFLKYGIISLEDWELTDTEKEYSEELLKAMRKWMYQHTENEKNQLIHLLSDNFEIFKGKPILVRRHNNLVVGDISIPRSNTSVDALGEYPSARSAETEMSEMPRLNSTEKLTYFEEHHRQ
jgi:hypothetical protein